LQGRDVNDLGGILELAREPLAHERVDGGQECRQRLAGTGWCGDQHVSACLDRRPRLSLRWRRGSKGAIKPGANRGVKQGGRAHGKRITCARARGQAPAISALWRRKSTRRAHVAPGRLAAEPPLSRAVLLAMRRLGDRNDWWDWGVILLVVAGGTILLWAS